ncbi:hypothetical protein GALL_462040 [mine drainage metagenome]|uniref:Uncharacterized protein n=1 Tax=mine drainage metagenome TaxID=410659 RepID=A0A1J5PX79_9ZZZZ
MFGSEAPASATLDMAITRADFVRQLAAAFGAVESPRSGVFTGLTDECAWRISLQPAPPTRLGLIVLERWEVQIALDATPQKRALWWQRFTAYFHRGGG